MIEEYKNETVYRRSLSVAWHPKLIDIDLWIYYKYGTFVKTSTYRPSRIHAKDSGIHSTDPLQAEDLRSRDHPYPQEVADDINANWMYDPERPNMKVCIYHDIGNGPHWHVQACDNTGRRET